MFFLNGPKTFTVGSISTNNFSLCFKCYSKKINCLICNFPLLSYILLSFWLLKYKYYCYKLYVIQHHSHFLQFVFNNHDDQHFDIRFVVSFGFCEMCMQWCMLFIDYTIFNYYSKLKHEMNFFFMMTFLNQWAKWNVKTCIFMEKVSFK